ncbi:transposase [Nitrosomonas communis]|uniref:Transposase IS200 like n=1 Tax=Nitrosomonas communis TaxID=44574 RepID=A0A1I4XCY0_9PROT|nr:transposase [Nitrosomonas communis]SFN23635.1 Transposase IS200 like [Nitrosomonas communis]
MRDYQSLAHTTWDCKYHIVFIPKRRKKVIFGMIRKHLGGENFWARGYFVSTVGLDEEMVREYIQHQEKEDEHYDQLKLGM